jgi:hypothetical protein
LIRRTCTSAFCAVAAFLLLASARPALAIGVTISPTCGSQATHFIVSAGGYRFTCNSPPPNWSVDVDGTAVYGISAPLSGISFDLKTEAQAHECGGCFDVGTHTVHVIVEGSPICSKYECVFATYTVNASLPDPWVDDQHVTLLANGQDSVTITFNPPNGCGVPNCDAIYLVQALRLLQVTGSDSSCVAIDSIGFGFPTDVLKNTQIPSPSCLWIDDLPGTHDEFMNGLDNGLDTGQAGRSGPNPSPTWAGDAPHFNVPAGADKVIAQFEVNAYCGKGKNRGRYLGKTFWIYERSQGAARGRIHPDSTRGPDLAGPTSAFQASHALSRRHHSETVEPQPQLPSKGGTKCP